MQQWSASAVQSPVATGAASGGGVGGATAASGTTAGGGYDPFVFGLSMSPQEVEISEDVYVITAETAEAYKQSLSTPPKAVGSGNLFETDGGQTTTGDSSVTEATKTGDGGKTAPVPTVDKIAALRWSGEVPAQKWMNFYTKVLSRFATTKSLRLTVTVEVAPEGGVSKQAAEETKTALRELGLKDDADLS